MKKREENDAVQSTYFFFFIGGDEKEGRGGTERQRDRGRGRKVGGRTDLRSEKKFISINNHKKKELADELGKLAWFFGGWQFKAETSDMTPRDC